MSTVRRRAASCSACPRLVRGWSPRASDVRQIRRRSRCERFHEPAKPSRMPTTSCRGLHRRLRPARIAAFRTCSRPGSEDSDRSHLLPGHDAPSAGSPLHPRTRPATPPRRPAATSTRGGPPAQRAAAPGGKKSAFVRQCAMSKTWSSSRADLPRIIGRAARALFELVQLVERQPDDLAGPVRRDLRPRRAERLSDAELRGALRARLDPLGLSVDCGVRAPALPPAASPT